MMRFEIDTINRLRLVYVESDEINAEPSLGNWHFHQLDRFALKPILMTSITTILALIPIISAAELGADLQRPLVKRFNMVFD